MLGLVLNPSGLQGLLHTPTGKGELKAFELVVAETQAAYILNVRKGSAHLSLCLSEGHHRLRATWGAQYPLLWEPEHPGPLHRPEADLGAPCLAGDFRTAGRDGKWTSSPRCLPFT